MSSDFFGHVDGERPSNFREAVKSDPFEAMLGLCRVMGLHYEIREFEGRWSCKLEHFSHWPADFFGGAGTQTGHRSYTVCASETRLAALSACIPMVFSGLVYNCEQWRQCVKSHADLRSWFKNDSLNPTNPPAETTEEVVHG